MTWNQLKPSDSEKIRDLGTVIRANNKAIEENDTGVLADSLNQWAIHLVDRSTTTTPNVTPVSISTVGMLYCRTIGAENELFFQDSQGIPAEIQLTTTGKIGAQTTSYEAEDISYDGTITFNENNYVTAYGYITGSASPTLAYSSGIASVSYAGSAGLYELTFAANRVNNANYVVISTPIQGANVMSIPNSPRTTTNFRVQRSMTNGTPQHGDVMFIVVGGQ